MTSTHAILVKVCNLLSNVRFLHMSVVNCSRIEVVEFSGLKPCRKEIFVDGK